MNDQNKSRPSTEFLNSFVDGQLDAEEKNRAFVEISRDEAVSREVCELRKLHELVQFAYADVTPPSAKHTPGGRNHWLGMSVAAGFALTIGMVIGWVLHTPATGPVASDTTAVLPTKIAQAQVAATEARIVAAVVPTGTSSPQAAELPATAAAIPADTATHLAAAISTAVTTPAATADVATDAKVKILVHVNRASAAEHTVALNDIEMLVRHYREQGQAARIEVVVNGEGLNMLRSDITAQAERIRQMQQDYGNVTFAACQNTIDRLRREQGVHAKLLPGVTVIDSGVAQIMRRQHQGWAYIQV